MTTTMRRIATILALLAPAAARAQVPTAAPPGGTIAVVSAAANNRPAPRAFLDAVGEALATKGFTLLDAGHAAYTAELLLDRQEVGSGLAKSPNPGKAAVIGPGVALPLSTGRSELVPLQRVRLTLRIYRRGADGVVWAGAAVTVREGGTPRGADAAVAADLARALLGAYPAQPETLLGVP